MGSVRRMPVRGPVAAALPPVFRRHSQRLGWLPTDRRGDGAVGCVRPSPCATLLRIRPGLNVAKSRQSFPFHVRPVDGGGLPACRGGGGGVVVAAALQTCSDKEATRGSVCLL